MSYDIKLVDAEGNTYHTKEHNDLQGGTYALGGLATAEFNITYNYSKHFARVLGEKGVRSIYTLTGAQSVPLLRAAIEQLGTDEAADYWKATEGNARKALEGVLWLAEQCPDGVWQGD